MARTRKHSDEEILERAMQCFWTRGYLATSVDDLVQATGAQRSTLYRSFGGKATLFITAIEHYAVFRRSRIDTTALPREQVRQWMYAAVDGLLDPEQPRGCLLINTAGSFSALEPEVQARVTVHLDLLRGFFRMAIEAHRPGCVAEDGVAVLLGANTAVFLLARTGATPTELRTIIDTACQQAFVASDTRDLD